MAIALSMDFQQAGFQVVVQRDARLPVDQFRRLNSAGIRPVESAPQERDVFLQEAAMADWTVLIAPETNGALLGRSLAAIRSGARLLSPSPDFIAVASDKPTTLARLDKNGVPVPAGICLAADEAPPLDFPYPAVRKPVDGAGSCGVELLSHATPKTVPYATRLERFHAGIPASVSILCGFEDALPLPACRQRLGRPPSFNYRGGEAPMPARLARRAERLAMSALAAMPKTVGYVGIDLVLGDDPRGGDDVVIEVNPRLTTSYVGLQAICRDNLATVMASVALGLRSSASFHETRIVFDADGTLR